jgi:hypothetical protein
VGIGVRLHKLWGLRTGVIVSLLAASIAALWSVHKISVFPPGLTPRSLELATASTHVVVDTPTSTLVDLRQDTYNLDALRNRAVLLGNVIASTSVRRDIARRLGVPVEQLRIQAPLTTEQLAPPVDSENARRTSDILATSDEYRLNIQASPTVPVLDLYAQTSTADSAATLVDAAVDELRAYLAELAEAEGTPEDARIQLIQLGQGEGAVINGGINLQVALLAFLVAFGVCAATVIFIDRVRSGWRLATLSERGASG